MKKYNFLIITYLSSCLSLFGQSWAEDTLDHMSLEEKIGQLFIAPACPLRGEDHWSDWIKIMEQYHIGGALMKQGDSDRHLSLIHRLQKASKFPLLITADAEWGIGMRISDGASFPYNQTLGQIGDLDLIRKIGREIGKDCKRMGIHLNFSPVADVNNNPENVVIGKRSFGDDPKLVSSCVVAMIKGLQEEGVMACAKHFPGHGDTSVDSHVALPILFHDRKRLDEVELLPFRAAIQSGVKAIMSAHLLVPSIDETLPSTLSFATMNKILREEMGFEGLIITDALNMKALSHLYSPEEIALYAHLAGCDLLLFGAHRDPDVDDILQNQLPRAYQSLRKIYEEGILSVEFLDEKVLRILQTKGSFFK